MGIPSPATTELLEKHVRELMAEKTALETQIQSLMQGLEDQGIGMDAPLIDSEGFPRNDVDVAVARTSRNLVIRLRNDHTAVMSKIEKGLISLHQSQPTISKSEIHSTAAIPPSTDPSTAEKPFARVNAVAPDSPASEAGLQREDKLIRFGYVHAGNHDDLKRVNSLVAQCEGKDIEVIVLRSNERVNLILTPRSGWGGRGSLGCHIMPL